MNNDVIMDTHQTNSCRLKSCDFSILLTLPSYRVQRCTIVHSGVHSVQTIVNCKKVRHGKWHGIEFVN